MSGTAKEALTELRREQRMRERVYPNLIGRGKLTQSDANKFNERLLKAIEIVEAAVEAEGKAQQEPRLL